MLKHLKVPALDQQLAAERVVTRDPRPTLVFSVRRRLGRADADALAELVRDPRRWNELVKLSASHRSSVARVLLPSGPVVVKRYQEPGLFRLRTFGRYSRAVREARAMDLVAGALPDCPVRVLACAEDRRFGFVVSSYLVVTELAGSFDLRAVKSLEPLPRTRAIEVVLSALPALVAALHDAGVTCAGSLRGKNVLLQLDGEIVALIDQITARAPRRLKLRHRVRDLATLSLELRRFLDDSQWQAFLERYRQTVLDLLPEECERITGDGIERVAQRLSHRTPFTAALRAVKRGLRHSRFGRWASGQSRGLDEQR